MRGIIVKRASSREACSGLLVFILLLGWPVCASSAWGHPLSQGALDVTVFAERVVVRARVTVEEVVVTDMLTTPDNAASDGAPRPADAIYTRHAAYLVGHLAITADDKPLGGRVVSVAAPTTKPAAERAAPDREHVVYELEYSPASDAGITTRPAKMTLRQDVLVGVHFTPGVTWEASYATRIKAGDGPATEGLLLTSKQPIVYDCDWLAATPAAGAAPGDVRVDRWRMGRDYIAHGVHHILGGYDHLLFISALVLAAVNLVDLVKVVTAFTLAHTLTLTLAALKLVNLPVSVVEPMIAGSIVVVAAQNVFWPKQTRGWSRLAVAFGFGLFHGLGFAGGLLDAMQGMSGTTIVLAIAAFSLGVEIGHQMIVIPLFGFLKIARQTCREPAEKDRVSMLTLRYGSAIICVAGMYYLVGALGSAFSVAGRG